MRFTLFFTHVASLSLISIIYPSCCPNSFLLSFSPCDSLHPGDAFLLVLSLVLRLRALFYLLRASIISVLQSSHSTVVPTLKY